MASLHPTHGARIVLERKASEREVLYDVSIYEPDLVHRSVARIDGTRIHFGEWEGAPPPWAVTFAERVLAGLPKKHADDGSWPRKLVRWRQERG